MQTLTLTQPQTRLSGRWICEFPTDATRIIAHDCAVTHCTIIDDKSSVAAHCDAVQLIPPPSMPRGQYAADPLFGARVENCHIRSNGKLQGVFCSDGLLFDTRITDNVIDTQGQHYISLNGLLSGQILRNVKPDGTPCPIYLGNLRIGGGLEQLGELEIISFSSDLIRYAPLSSIVDEASLPWVVDDRGLINTTSNAYLKNFDVTGFRRALCEISTFPKDVLEHCRLFHRIAKKWGDLI